MGTMTLGNFRAELLWDLKNRSDTGATEGLTTTRQDTFINAGYLHVTHPTVFRHRELQYRSPITLANGQFQYTFTPNAGFGVILTGVRSASHIAGATDNLTTRKVKLFPRDMQWFDNRTHTSGAPRDYAIQGDTIWFSPVPSTGEVGQVVVLSGWREPSLLANPGNQTVLSTRWDEIVLLAARWRAELHLGYRDLAEATKLDFTGLINEYRDFEQLQGEDTDWMAEVRTESHMESA